MIGSPLFDQVVVHLANGKTFIVTADNNSPANIYIQSATLNGVSLGVPYVTWNQIMAGGELRFEMGSSPSQWALKWTGKPL